jgi:sterol desaturase/sphingolipid hydroxylase (fatty acid hydroxylase superfamily)
VIEILAIAMMWIAVGFIYCNALEWAVHKYVLHRFGKKKDSVWRFHWQHHASSRKNTFRDFRWEGLSLHRDKEFWSIVVLLVLHIPTIWISPVLFFTLVWRGLDYYRVHKKSHDNGSWAKKHVPWHWDHHMGPKAAIEANWCVTYPLFDYIMGTRVKYFETKKYYLDVARHSVKRLREMKNEKAL